MTKWSRWVGIVAVLLFVGLCIGPAAGQASDSGDGSIEIDTAVNETGGEQTVIVRLTERSDRAIRTTNHDNQVSAMKSHAAETRSPFERFASGNPHVTITDKLWLANALVVRVDTDRVPLERLGIIDNVERIHQNYAIKAIDTAVTDRSTTTSLDSTTTIQPHSTVTSADSGTTYTRAIEHINASTVLEQGSSGTGVRVAVIDTGVNPNHPSITITDDNWACFIDCAGNPAGPHDNNGHGTHVSGTVIGTDNNDQNLQIGIAPNATLLHAKGLDDDGSGNFITVTKSMEWAVENNADVLSMSLASKDSTIDDFIAPVRNAHASGTLVVGAIGNTGSGTSGSPANVYDAVAVGSVDVEPRFSDRDFGLTTDAVSDFSGGETIDTQTEWDNPPEEWPDQYDVPDVTAPGSIIWSADNNITQSSNNAPDETTDLRYASGTSMAAPHIAGVASLMISSSKEELSPKEIQTTLKTTAVDTGESPTRQGVGGRVDALAAVSAVSKTEPTAEYAVRITEAPETAVAGESIPINYEVENTGDGAGTQDIVFTVNGKTQTTIQDVSLSPGEVKTQKVEYTTSQPDIGELQLGINSENTTATRTLTITEPPADYAVEITSAPGSVVADEQMAVDYTVENVGGKVGNQDIEFIVNSESKKTIRDVSLSPGESVDMTINYTPNQYEVGELQLGISSQNSTDTRTVTVTTTIPLTIQQFDAIDTNNDGSITLSELVSANYERVQGNGTLQTPDGGVDITLREIIEINQYRLGNKK